MVYTGQLWDWTLRYIRTNQGVNCMVYTGQLWDWTLRYIRTNQGMNCMVSLVSRGTGH